MRRITKVLKTRALDSVELAIEFFNRPSDTGRMEAVLIFLQRAFEMLLKAAIFEKRGTIRCPGDRETYKFGKCLKIVKSDLDLIDEDAARTLRGLSGQRDAAMHYYVELREDVLYLYTQSGVTLFADILEKAFGECLATYLPNRVLPVSAHPPQDLAIFFDDEFSQIRALLQPDTRRRAEAYGRLRPLAIMESNVDDEGRQPSDDEVQRLAERVKKGEDWRTIFPGIATLRLQTTGNGLTYSIRIVKNNQPAVPVQLTDSHADAATVVIKETNLLDRYPFLEQDLIEQLGRPQTVVRALTWHLGLKECHEFYREFKHHSVRIKGYSRDALTRLSQEFQMRSDHDVEEIRTSYLKNLRAQRQEAKRAANLAPDARAAS